MRKHKELSDPSSCMSKAHDSEMTFVLLGRDPAAPLAIRAWVEARILAGKNQRHDPQICEALRCAAVMETEREAVPSQRLASLPPVTLLDGVDPEAAWLTLKAMDLPDPDTSRFRDNLLIVLAHLMSR